MLKQTREKSIGFSPCASLKRQVRVTERYCHFVLHHLTARKIIKAGFCGKNKMKGPVRLVRKESVQIKETLHPPTLT